MVHKIIEEDIEVIAKDIVPKSISLSGKTLLITGGADNRRSRIFRKLFHRYNRLPKQKYLRKALQDNICR